MGYGIRIHTFEIILNDIRNTVEKFSMKTAIMAIWVFWTGR